MTDNQRNEFQDRLGRIKTDAPLKDDDSHQPRQRNLDAKTLVAALSPFSYLFAWAIGTFCAYATIYGLSFWMPELFALQSTNFTTDAYLAGGSTLIVSLLAFGASNAITILLGMQTFSHMILTSLGVGTGFTLIRNGVFY